MPEAKRHVVAISISADSWEDAQNSVREVLYRFMARESAADLRIESHTPHLDLIVLGCERDG